MNSLNHDHFNSISSRYQEAAKSWESIYEQVSARLEPLVKEAVVVDVGNGGRFAYNPSDCKKVIVMDISPRILEGIDNPDIVKVIGDARKMEGIEKNSADVIIFILALHHINGDSVQESLHTLDRILKESQDKLRTDGYLVIVEALMPKPVYRIQALLFNIEQYILRRLGVPMIFFYSRKIITTYIAKVFDLDPGELEEVPIQMEGWIDPLGGSFPGIIKIPAKIMPYNFMLLIAKKKK